MLALLVSAGILLLPDVSALEIPGVLRLERKLEENTRRQEDLVAMVQRKEVSQRQQVINVFDLAKLAELVGLQDEKRQRFDSDAP
jgi:hypothetical protein